MKKKRRVKETSAQVTTKRSRGINETRSVRDQPTTRVLARPGRVYVASHSITCLSRRARMHIRGRQRVKCGFTVIIPFLADPL